MGVGGVVFASGCASRALGGAQPALSAGGPGHAAAQDFFFLQLTDTHWGYEGPANPHADVTLERAVATINASDVQPDFIVFTGDLTHQTDDAAVRRDRMLRFRDIVSKLKVKDLRFLPGEHDAAADQGDAFQTVFGDMHHAFDHGGVHFVALDNVSRDGALGSDQLAWLEADLAKVAASRPVVVLAHRPLFDLYPDWDWFTKDGARAVEILQRRANVTVFYGHIHQELHRTTGTVPHHAARSLVFPLPPPGAAPKRAPLVWDPASTDHGLGWRQVAMDHAAARIVEVAYR